MDLIRRGRSLVIVLVTSIDISPNFQALRFAVIPITVRKQVPNAVASKSVGEKASPLPS